VSRYYIEEDLQPQHIEEESQARMCPAEHIQALKLESAREGAHQMKKVPSGAPSGTQGVFIHSRRVSLAGYLTGAFMGVITATPIARAVFSEAMPAGFAEASFILSCFLIGLFTLFVIKG
jgi:hypothetical protein